ncbi:MAG: ThuA domain-containing protein [Candidatus Sumerlaeota bacterium]|nr:ThuA domain-containing protein [Candidatus Sumerlaeota bacterium]
MLRKMLVAFAAVTLAAGLALAAPAPGKEKAAKAGQPKAAKAPRPAPGPPSAEDLAKVKDAAPAKATVQPQKPRKLLIFTLTKGFPHASVPIAAEAMKILGEKTGAYQSVISDDINMFKADSLKSFDAVCMDNSTGDLFLPKNLKELPPAEQDAARKLDEEVKKSFTDYVKSGKGLIGIHAATDCLYNWADYGDMMGGYFDGHPWHEEIGVKVDDVDNPINAAFKGQGFMVTDEIYTFKEPYSRDKLRVLLSMDTAKTNMDKGDKIKRTDGDFAVSWIHLYGQGRVFYCSLGHENQIFWTPAILQHYLDGIQFALGDLKADATPSAQVKTKTAGAPRMAEAKPAKEKKPAASKPTEAKAASAPAEPKR